MRKLRMPARRTLLLLVAVVSLGPFSVEEARVGRADEMGASQLAVAQPGREFLVGGDISALARIEQAGGLFRQDGKPEDAIRILTGCGCNCFRLRLFVNPTYQNVVVNDLPYTIHLARRIKAAGARLLLDFHYSDTWADPGHQEKPRAWQGLDFPALEHQLYTYTRDSITEMKRQEVLPDLVQIGNEITPGMLWPDGKLHGVGDPEEQWVKFARLVKAAVRGAREGAGAEQLRIVIHVHCGGDRQKTRWFFGNLQEQQVSYDVIGLSYYPWWHGTLDDLKENLVGTARTFDKDVFVVETAYPYRPLRFTGNKGRNKEAFRWPQTPEGQAAFLKELVRAVRNTPGGRGIGVLWWYPESVPVEGLRIWHGGATALFDAGGNVLPAVAAFQNQP